jgi:hypothetical protein
MRLFRKQNGAPGRVVHNLEQAALRCEHEEKVSKEKKRLSEDAEKKGFYVNNASDVLPYKSSQTGILFPASNVLFPYSVPIEDFRRDFFPVFLKNYPNEETNTDADTLYIRNEEEFEHYYRKYMTKFKTDNRYLTPIVQEYIKPVTNVASHIRVILSIAPGEFNCFIAGAIVMYNPDKKEKRSNMRRRGLPIPITGLGALENIAGEQENILSQMQIDPYDRKIPDGLLKNILYNETGFSLFEYITLFKRFTGSGSKEGFHIKAIDNLFGYSGSRMKYGPSVLHSNRSPGFYVSEVEMTPDTAGLEGFGIFGINKDGQDKEIYIPAIRDGNTVHLYGKCVNTRENEELSLTPRIVAKITSCEYDNLTFCQTCLPAIQQCFPWNDLAVRTGYFA